MGREFHEHQEQDCPGTVLKKQQMKQSYSTYHIIENMETELLMSLHYPQCNTHMCVHDSCTQKNTYVLMCKHTCTNVSTPKIHSESRSLSLGLRVPTGSPINFYLSVPFLHEAYIGVSFFSVFLLCSTSLFNNFKGPRHHLIS